MVRTLPLGLEEALRMTLERVKPLAPVRVELLDGLNRALAEDLAATVDSPSIDASMKDGYAVISREVEAATRENPVKLRLADHLAAGESREVDVQPDTAVRILTGAKIPSGADAVVAEEFTAIEDGALTVYNNAEPGRNILPKSSDVAVGQLYATYA